MVDMDLILLGSLLARPAHGYQLKQNIEATYGKRYVNLSNSALYPRLARLEAGGFIEGKREPQEKVPDRKTFHVTPEGLARLKALVAMPLGPREDEFDFLARASFFGLITREERQRIIEPLYREKVIELEEARDKKEKFARHMDKFSIAALDYGISGISNIVELYRKLSEME
jgi:DNA-binding PadR family transcriptional regulator